MSAPRSNSNCTMFTQQRFAACDNAVSPCCAQRQRESAHAGAAHCLHARTLSLASTAKPRSSSIVHTSRWPKSAALKSAVSPRCAVQSDSSAAGSQGQGAARQGAARGAGTYSAHARGRASGAAAQVAGARAAPRHIQWHVCCRCAALRAPRVRPAAAQPALTTATRLASAAPRLCSWR